nr:cytochrome b/b6 domain-containing protein [uncultured Vibrio sp.]
MGTIHEDEKNYGAVAKILHWGMAIIILVLIAIGTYMIGLDKTEPSKMHLTGMHKSFGVIFMQLVILRIIWSRINRSGPQWLDT